MPAKSKIPLKKIFVTDMSQNKPTNVAQSIVQISLSKIDNFGNFYMKMKENSNSKNLTFIYEIYELKNNPIHHQIPIPPKLRRIFRKSVLKLNCGSFWSSHVFLF